MADILWKETLSLSTTVHVITAVVILLMYFTWKNYDSVRVLQKEHNTLMGKSEGYTARIGGSVLSHTGAKDSGGFGKVGSTDGFLGAYGPPVLYPMGDVEAQRKYEITESGKASTSNEYDIDFTKKYASGRNMFASKTDGNGKVYYVPLPDNASESMLSDENLLARAQGFRSY
jgi:hypothetical protein